MPRPDPIVITNEGAYPYSKGLMAQSLMACGIPPDRAYRVARLIDAELRRGDRQPLATDGLRARVEALLAEGDPADVHRYRRSRALRRGERTLVVLVGGAPGVGKSAVATQLAHRLGITRIASTDTIREVLRTTLAPGIAPAIASSSFEAHRVLPPEAGDADPLLVGFFEQADVVSRAARGIVARTLRERVPLVLEGVHVVPGGGLAPQSDPHAVVVEALLVVADAAQHESHFRFRAEETADGRPLARYLDRFQEIRRIQAALESTARRAGVPVIEAARLDGAVRALLDLVLDRVAEAVDPHAPTRRGPRLMPTLADLFADASKRGVPRYRCLPKQELVRLLAAPAAAEPAVDAPAPVAPSDPAVPVRLERDGPLAVLVLDDPARRNALGEAAFDALGPLLDEVAADPEIRALAIAGTGPAFCAAVLEYDGLPDGGERLGARGTALLDRIASLPVPVIALLHGHAVGGGAELALACDMRVAAPGAELRLVHTGIGLVPGWGGALHLARLVGDAAAFRLIALRARIHGEAACAAGLVDEIVPADGLRERARELAAHIATGDRAAIARMKALLHLPPAAARADAARDAFLASWPARRLDHVRPDR